MLDVLQKTKMILKKKYLRKKLRATRNTSSSNYDLVYISMLTLDDAVYYTFVWHLLYSDFKRLSDVRY